MITYLTKILFELFQSKGIPDEMWYRVMDTTPVLKNLNVKDKVKLRKLTRKFLHKKHISTAQDLELTPYMEVVIAAQACLLILNLHFNYYQDLREIIIYPGLFKVNREYTDNAGVVHQSNSVLSGEAWSHGPIVLSWQDVYQDVHSPRKGHNVVLHEFAHKIDMLTGSANGMPPLHASMNKQDWTNILSSAYQRLNQQIKMHGDSNINSYAATDPGEFFSVISEYFFTAPEILEKECPEVYLQFKVFYFNKGKYRT